MYGFFPGNSLVVNSVMRWPAMSAAILLITVAIVAEPYVAPSVTDAYHQVIAYSQQNA